MISINFVRVQFVKIVVESVNRLYGPCNDAIGLPPYLLDEPMRYMPMADYFLLLERIENFTKDELYSAHISKSMNLNRQDAPMRNYILMSENLLTGIKRTLYFYHMSQTGISVNVTKVGNIVKWRYKTTLIPGKGQSHHSVLMAAVPSLLLKWFHGDSYVPLSLHLTGSPLGRPGELDELCGCPIVWNSAQTEVWFPFSDLICPRPETRPQLQLPLVTLDQLMAFMDTPRPENFNRVVNELVNYARFFGFPRLDFVAQRLGISPLKLQRKLQENELTFKELVQVVLCLEAIQMMEEGRTFEDITCRLGFKNTQTFAKAFKRLYGLTPTQYRRTVLKKVDD